MSTGRLDAQSKVNAIPPDRNVQAKAGVETSTRVDRYQLNAGYCRSDNSRDSSMIKDKSHT